MKPPEVEVSGFDFTVGGAQTHHHHVFTQETTDASRSVLDGESRAVLHVGPGLTGVVPVVSN